MTRTANIEEKYNAETGEFTESTRCPFCDKVYTAPALRKPYPDKHMVRDEHGCGGNIMIFQKDEDGE